VGGFGQWAEWEAPAHKVRRAPLFKIFVFQINFKQQLQFKF
jgi:hypothetical protein